jgi:predicted nuclease of predicted toxin-antitoxin system
MDENVHGWITDGLRLRGVDVLTAQDDGREETDDLQILFRATDLGRVLFSQDQDLLRVAAACQRGGEEFSGVIYAHQRDVPIGMCIADLELIAKAGSMTEYSSSVVYLPL